MDQLVRKPRLRVTVDGIEVDAERADVTNNNFFQADSWSLDCVLFADPKKGIKWWRSKKGKTVEISMGFEIDGSVQWKSLIQGVADNTEYDIDRGLVLLNGRDHTAKLIREKTTETYQNLSASEIVKKLAAKLGMTADVTATSGTVGRHYNQTTTHHRHATTGQTQTAWDMICFLARREGYDAYVTGNTLHFHPTRESDGAPRLVRVEVPGYPNTALPVALHAANPVRCLRLREEEDLARDVKVIARSWNSQRGRRMERSYPSAGRTVQSTSDGQQVTLYEIEVPNATEEDLLQAAQTYYREIIQHTREVSWEEPGNLDLDPRQKIKLVGEIDDFAQEYFVDEITRELSFDNALFTQKVRAKNKAPSQEY